MRRQTVSAYNRFVAGVPFCQAISTKQMRIIERLMQDDKHLHGQQLRVVKQGEKILALAHWGVAGPSRRYRKPLGVIAALYHAPGDRAAGQNLLDYIHADFLKQRIHAVEAFHQNWLWPFYHQDHAYLSDTQAHLKALFNHNDYREEHGEEFFEWRDFSPPRLQAARLKLDYEVKEKPGRGELPDVIVTAHNRGRHVGACHSCSCGGFGRDEGAEHTFLTMWLGVEREFRGKGLGKHILARGMSEMARVGYRHATISTSMCNSRAALFYSNFGYRLADWTFGYRRRLLDGPTP